MPRGDNPNSRKNLIARSSKEARKNGKKGGEKSGETRAGTKRAREAAKKSLSSKNPFTPELLNKIKENLAIAAAEGDREAQKMIMKIFGEDISDAAKKKAKADLKKTEAETKKIIAETKLIELKMASPEEAEDDGFFDAIEGRLADVWGGDPE